MTQQEALDILKLGHNVYLTGSAGSGKTYVLNKYIEYLREHDIEVGITASTGIAATHMNGMTIHSWSGLGIRDTLTPQDLDAMEEKQYLWKRFQHTKVLIIDEVSMLHHFRLDLIERICRTFKRNDKPFGGLQVILCGDFFQLPPVARRGEQPAQFIYHSAAWEMMNVKVCYLHEQHRQKDEEFLQVLNDLRANSMSSETLNLLTARFNKKPEVSIQPTKLYTHNVDVDMINDEELAKIEGETQQYFMTEHGKEHIVDIVKKSCLAPSVLSLKKGAQVMFVKNNYEAGYANGTLGTIVDFDHSRLPIVKLASGKRITVQPMEWQIMEEGRLLAEIKQIPLRLAWAITIHKSQGMSLDAIEVDLSKSFEKGMGYVALSRVRTLSGLKLLGLNDVALEVHEEVLEFDKTLKQASQEAREEIAQFTCEQIAMLHQAVRELLKPKKKESKLPSYIQTIALLQEKKDIKAIAEIRGLTVGTIIDHIEKAQQEGNELDITFLKDKAFTEARFKKITNAFSVTFKKTGDTRLAPIKQLLGDNVTYDELRLAKLFIDEH
jgi:ATP-dependent exoDNAse (exonuclease V) alpha subunit